MKNIFNIPNQLTFARMFITPVFISLLIYSKWIEALIIFIAACITDALDGYVARRLNKKTTLGSIIDPLADKIMMAGAYITLSDMKVIPAWLAVAVVSRDALLIGGVIFIKLFGTKPIEIKPSIAGKLTTFSQMSTVAYVLCQKVCEVEKETISYTLYLSTFLLTLISGYQYFKKGITFIQSNGTQNIKG